MGAKRREWTIPESWPVKDPAQYRPLSWFVPYPQNPRTHPPAQIAMLALLLKNHGPDQPIVVDEERVILKGHGRLDGAKLGGLEQFTFVQRLGLPEADKRAMRIQDNQSALLSGWDNELVRGEVGALKLAGYDVALLGFGEAQLVQFTTTPGPPAQFPAVDENLPTSCSCPRCGYAWSGNPQAGRDPKEVAKAKPRKGAKR